MQSDTIISHSPSFNTYSSSDTLAQIAARVVQEFQDHSDDDFNNDDYLFHHQTEEEEQLNNCNHESDQKEEAEAAAAEEEEFEFAILCREPDLSPIPADQIFYNGQIRPVYPLFNTDLLFADDVGVDNSISSATSKTSIPVRLPLGKLFIEERERDSASCSSSEADELDRVPVGTYCVWRPKAEESPGRCKKSNSTGSSKRWKFRDLLYRSNSDGKDTFVFLAPSIRKRGGKVTKGMKEEAAKITGNDHPNGVAEGGDGATATATATHYVRKGVVKVSDQRLSYLPRKKDMVGLFANVSGVSRNLHPF